MPMQGRLQAFYTNGWHGPVPPSTVHVRENLQDMLGESAWSWHMSCWPRGHGKETSSCVCPTALGVRCVLCSLHIGSHWVHPASHDLAEMLARLGIHSCRLLGLVEPPCFKHSSMCTTPSMPRPCVCVYLSAHNVEGYFVAGATLHNL